MKLKSIAQCCAAAAAFLSGTTAVHACSVCITGTSDPSTEAFNASVLFLLTTPYLVVGSIAGALFLVYRRAVKRDREQSAEETMHLALSQEESAR